MLVTRRIGNYLLSCLLGLIVNHVFIYVIICFLSHTQRHTERKQAWVYGCFNQPFYHFIEECRQPQSSRNFISYTPLPCSISYMIYIMLLHSGESLSHFFNTKIEHEGWQTYAKTSLAQIREIQETEASSFPLPSAAAGRGRGRGGPPRGGPPRGGGVPPRGGAVRGGVADREGRGGRGAPFRGGRGGNNFPEVEILVPATPPPSNGGGG